MYKWLRSILFLFDAEKVHHFSMGIFSSCCNNALLYKMINKRFSPIPNPVRLGNMVFQNPVGLAAGFDKNALYLKALQCLGFSHVEIGTVTPKPQQGNEQPRLFRLPQDQALINRMGFNNDGAQCIANRLKDWRAKVQGKNKGTLIIGGNIGKNKDTPNEEAWKDYEICFKTLHPYVDYFTVNVSSPNTPGLRALQQKEALHKILTHLQNINKQMPLAKPILLKIAPDLSEAELNDIIDLALEIKLDALVVSNTSLQRSSLSEKTKIKATQIGAGGLSGKPIKQLSTKMLASIAQKTKGSIPIIASGGIFTGADALEKINAGAAMVQVYTGFIYEGPAIVKKIGLYLNR